MNAKVQEFIEKMKAEEQKKRDEHLISLGLIDDELSYEEKKYVEESELAEDVYWDDERKEYYKSTKVLVPLKVTDDEYQEILKYSALLEQKEATKQPVDSTYSDGIRTIGKILLFGHIIGGVILYLLLADRYDDIAWIAIVFGVVNALQSVLIIGFSKIVAVAEHKLSEYATNITPKQN